ncbi:MAG TPA: NADH-ubiquinone oxidoreductase-F iron-sulfur binding region domain-containing protein [Myxococcota bacterium]|nr:NADH-ubiquinone oxidoreductase-F iron-sulfur binding region domain-containing protein [Myxococcota bacterium]HRY92723.1 NADH-ubiquinone oxidoreductase-F iron-sulfur binding region domain-containing protein [Myxococcota bacterium]
MSHPQVLFARRRPGQTVSLETYLQEGGYQALGGAVGKQAPAALRKLVLDSGLRGRGGAGFPTGQKWSFFPADAPGPKYLVCNCDEMEPGTYKDRELLVADPHALVEGMALAAYALGVTHGYVFVRYDYEDVFRALERAVAEAHGAGFLGERILGTDFGFELHVHGSAGRYILGEETSLLNGLEGVRPNPRLRPPFPAQRGLFGRPTTVQNVETLCNVPHIALHGAEWFKGLALTPGEAGTKLFGLSGHLNRTECFELPMGVPLREVVEVHGGGVRQGRRFKACLPGGASTPYLTAAHLDVPMDFGNLDRAGSRLGTAGVTVFDERTCMVAATLNLLTFFARESCGWCTPCRDGLPYVCYLLERFERGQAGREELALLKAQPAFINQSFCALAQGAMGPLEGLLRHFEQELLDHVTRGGCPFGGA